MERDQDQFISRNIEGAKCGGITADNMERIREKKSVWDVKYIAKNSAPFSSIICRAIKNKQHIFKNDSLLHAAVRIKNERILAKLLNQQEWHHRSDTEGENGETPLHLACTIDNLEAVKLLLKHGSNPNIRRKCFHQLHCIHIAAENGSFQVLSYLLTELPDSIESLLSITDVEGSTPLHWAVQGQRKDCIELLINYGAAIDVAQTSGFLATPLHLACYQGLAEVVELMFKRQPEQFKSAMKIYDDEGLTPMHRAASLNLVPVLSFIVKHIENFDINFPDADGRAAVTLAATSEAWGTFKLLVESGVDAFQTDKMGRTSIHAGAIFGTFPAQADKFCEVRNDIADYVDLADKLGCTALHYASAYGNLEAVTRLIALGANVELKSSDLKSALHFAAEYGALEVVQLLFSQSTVSYSMINDADSNGFSALSLASRNGHSDVVGFLISKGALSFRDVLGQTCLHYAAAKGHTGTIKLLLVQFPTVIDYADVYGCTALHMAATGNHPNAVACLLGRGALLLRNQLKQTAIDIAISEKHEAATLAFLNDLRWREFLTIPSRIYGTVALGLTRHLPDIMKVALDRCISNSKHPALDEKFHVTYDFSILEPELDCYAEDTKHKRKLDNLLTQMSVLQRTQLVTHPLARVLLERKWRLYGMYAYCSLIGIYLLFLALLTYVVVTGVQWHLVPYLMQQSCDNINNFSSATANTSAFQWLMNEVNILKNNSMTSRMSVITNEYACMMVILIILTLLLIKEGIELHSKGWRYFYDVVNYLELVMSACCISFISALFYELYNETHLDNMTWQLGSLSIFFAWFNLLRYCQPFGGIGIYAVMFFSVLKTLLKVSFFFFILTAAFTVTFFELIPILVWPKDPKFYTLNEPLNVKDLFTPHLTLYTSALRVGAMTIGDVDTINNYITPMNNRLLPFPLMTFLVLIVFFLMMPILLNNLLTGLAVGDISSTLDNASHLRLQNQIELHNFIEVLLPRKYQMRFRRELQAYDYYPNRRQGWVSELSRMLAGCANKKIIVGTQAELDQSQDVEPEKNELARLRTGLQKVHYRMDKQERLQSEIMKKLEELRELCSQKLEHNSHQPRVEDAAAAAEPRAQLSGKVSDDHDEKCKMLSTMF